MDTIVILNSGKVADSGPYEDVRLRSASLIDQSAATLTVSDSVSDGSNEADDKTTSKASKVAVVEDDEIAAQKANLSRQNGSWSVYKYYSKSAGASTMMLWAFFTLIGAITANIIRKLKCNTYRVGWR
jgi:ATP-binding cassette, subfamily C (CFTR/MRP), member 1